MAIIFNDGYGQPVQITQLQSYISNQLAQSKVQGTLVFGQSGSRILDPSNVHDLNSLIALQVLPPIYSPEYMFMTQPAAQDSTAKGLNQQTYNASTRGQIENILSQYVIWFVYDLVSDSAPLTVSISNQFDSPIANAINQLLNSPITQAIQTIGGGTGSNLAQILKPVLGLFGANAKDVSDIFSMLFLSKVKTVELWQGGDIKFKVPLSFKLLDYDNDPFNNVILPAFILYALAGYNRIPFGASTDSNTNNNWVAEINSILRFVIGPAYFKLQVGQFLSSDENNPFAISNLNISYSQFIDGLPTVQTIQMEIENVNPIVIEDLTSVGDPDQASIVPTNSNEVYKFNSTHKFKIQ